MLNNPITVSICCVTFNHKEYISQALNSFFKQQTSFNFEILIHDDASTDGTREIIEDYANKYPSLIFPIIQKENQFSQGQRGFSFKYNFPRARGKYIALCEGDDYWIDPLKLQMQIDFLEKNSSISACFTNAKIVDEINNSHKPYFDFQDNRCYTIGQIIGLGGSFFPSPSLVFRNYFKKAPEFVYEVKSGDRALALLLSHKGDFYLMNEITCVYRKHQGGVFTSILNDKLKRKEIFVSNIDLLRKFNIYTNFEHQKRIDETISTLSKKALLKDKKSLFRGSSLPLLKNLKWKDRLSLFYNYFFSN